MGGRQPVADRGRLGARVRGQPDRSLAELCLDEAGRHLLTYGLFDGSLVKAFGLRTGRHLSLHVPSLAIDGGLSTLAW